jgi:hypothetical protein
MHLNIIRLKTTTRHPLAIPRINPQRALATVPLAEYAPQLTRFPAGPMHRRSGTKCVLYADWYDSLRDCSNAVAELAPKVRNKNEA